MHPQARQLGRKIVARRQARGWDQRTCARAAGINPGYLSLIERGLRTPSLSTLHKLRVALGLDDDVFLAWIDMLRPETSKAA